MERHEKIQAYLEALGGSDLNSMLALFSPDAIVQSPFLGEISAKDFFPKVFEASKQSTITLYEIFANEGQSMRAAAYFKYDWVLRDGTEIEFQCVDIFEFDRNDKISQLIILYDTHPIRDSVGDKYA